MPPTALSPGLAFSRTLIVDAGLTVPAVSPHFASFADMPPVFATAFLVGFVEATCVEALRPYLADGQRTVGTHVDLSHVAATPVGMAVTAAVELVAVKGSKLRFKVAVRDEADVVSTGFHERAIVDGARFIARVAAKRDSAKRDVAAAPAVDSAPRAAYIPPMQRAIAFLAATTTTTRNGGQGASPRG